MINRNMLFMNLLLLYEAEVFVRPISLE